MLIRYIYRIIIATIILSAGTPAFSQSEFISPKREFRGVWVATVANIDWPSKPGLSTQAQKDELISILDDHQRQGLNSIILQIRPSTDAFYAKGREGWSRFLTGQQSKAPVPFYDPLEFAIEEAHKRAMELHAWFNPYRATTDLIDAHTSADHITRLKPDWFFNYGGKKLFNPGIPEVREYITNVIMDVVRNYDIDGIHFDDYFYPYPEKSQSIPDTETFMTYGNDFTNINDWRRNNVDLLIKTLSDSIHTAKKYVKFGISPFGIWRNKSQDAEGSESRGLDAYSTLYADSRKWIKEGWIDYINPQIYFPFFYAAAPFEKLTDWWSNNSFGRHVYIGQGAYRIIENREGWRDSKQVPNQVRYIRENPRVQGSVFFSSKSLRKNLRGVSDSLATGLYNYPSLHPQMLWLDDVPPLSPLQLQATLAGNNQVILNWEKPLQSRDGEMAYGYVIYRFNAGEEINFDNNKNILKITFDSNSTSFIDNGVRPEARYTYAVTAIDRLKNESPPSNLAETEIKNLAVAEVK